MEDDAFHIEGYFTCFVAPPPMRFWTDDRPLYIHRAQPGSQVPGRPFAVMDEGDEITMVSATPGEGAAGPYSCITMGPFDLGMVGILAKASTALAEAGVPVFVLSTFRHDHILVPQRMQGMAIEALSRSGFVLSR